MRMLGRPLRLLWTVGIGILMLAVGALLAVSSFELQVALVVLMIVAVSAIWLIPRAVRKEPSVTVPLLVAALVVKVLGALARYVMLQSVFEGGDALSYHQAGEANYLLVRSLDFSFIQPPYFGTTFLEDLVPFLYALTGPSMLGAFVVFSMLSFVGTWLFYRAHRIAFPDGQARLYFVLLFFLPTMAFWPSSLGKDALIVFGLGLATYGLAQLLQRISFKPLLQIALGSGLAFGVRPAVGVMFLAGASLAFLVRPGALRSPMGRPIGIVFLGPVVLAGLVVAVSYAAEYEQLGAEGETVLEQYVATHERLLAEGGSVIEGPAPTSPAGFGQAVVTVMFRPFPWELADPLAAVAGLESLVLLVVILARLRSAGRAIRLWRGGMVLAALVVTLALVVPLTAIANFGLLVRQRAQLLPFLFMIFTAAPQPRRAPRAQRAPRPAPRQAVATPG